MLARRWAAGVGPQRRSGSGAGVASLQDPQRCPCRHKAGLAAPKLSTNLSCGLVGLPNVGKSTIFNALTRMAVPAENYPFCTIDPHVGMVEVPDLRIESLRVLSSSKKAVPAAMQFVDIAGLVKGASEGAGMGNAFLQNIRDVDAILHLVRCFDSPDVVRADGEIEANLIDPAGDAFVIDTELLLADLQTVERALAKLKRKADPALAAILEETLEALEAGTPVRHLALEPEAALTLRPYNLLTAKPLLYLTNVGLGDELDPSEVSKNDKFCIKNEEFCIKNEKLCI